MAWHRFVTQHTKKERNEVTNDAASIKPQDSSSRKGDEKKTPDTRPLHRHACAHTYTRARARTAYPSTWITREMITRAKERRC